MTLARLFGAGRKYTSRFDVEESDIFTEGL
jgi:hypothetical protein